MITAMHPKASARALPNLLTRTTGMIAALAIAALGGSPSAAEELPERRAPFVNSVGMQFTPIPAGSFLMGSRDDDTAAFDAEKPQRPVSISKPFHLGTYEVTQGQWEAVMGSAAYAEARSNPYYALPGMAERLDGPDHPVTVSWNDAQEFIRKLNAIEGRQTYRLPTEAEWEYAARAGTTTAYSFGDDERDLGAHAWFGEDFASGSHHVVGQKIPNPWGLHDVHGNVWEWVEDRYGPYPNDTAVVDPAGPSSGARRVVRGGSWHETSTSWRSAFRKPYDADYRGISIGFRLAMSGTP